MHREPQGPREGAAVMSTEHAAARAICPAVARALAALALFSGAARGAAPEPPPEVGPDKPYLEFYMGEVLVRGWAVRADWEEETFDFYDAMAQAEFRGISFDKLPPGDRDRVRELAAQGPEPGVASGVPEPAGGEKIPATKFFLKTGRQIVGLELPELATKQNVFIKNRAAQVFPIPRDLIESSEQIQVDEREIYSLEEIYQKRWDRIDPNSASDNYEIAEYLRGVGHYVPAREHYERAKALDPRFVAQANDRLEEVAVIIRTQVVEKLNKEIHAADRGRRYGEMVRKIKQLGALDPNSPAYNRWMEKIGEIEAKLAQSLRREVVTSYYLAMDEMIRKWAFGRVTDGADIPGKIVSTDNGTYMGVFVEETEDSEDGPGVIVLENDGREIRINKSTVKDVKSVNLEKRRRQATFAESRAYVTDTDGGLTADIMGTLVEQYGDLIVAHKASQAGGDEGDGDPPDYDVPAPDDIFEVPEADDDSPEKDPNVQVEVLSYEEAGQAIRTYWDGRLDDIYEVTEHGTKHTPPAATQHRANWGIGSWLRDGAMPKAMDDGGQATDPEAWWRSLSNAPEVKYQVLRAMAAEALCRVDHVDEPKCSYCAGKGYVRQFDMSMRTKAGSKICSVCKGIGAKYVVKYR
jgi:hypothetical protein